MEYKDVAILKRFVTNLVINWPISEFSSYHCKNSLKHVIKRKFIKLLVSAQKRIDTSSTLLPLI